MQISFRWPGFENFYPFHFMKALRKRKTPFTERFVSVLQSYPLLASTLCNWLQAHKCRVVVFLLSWNTLEERIWKAGLREAR